MMPQSIDVTGLSTESMRLVESIVNMLRAKETEQSAMPRDPEQWSKELRLWAESHPKRGIVIDDSRESIYAGRGE